MSLPKDPSAADIREYLENDPPRFTENTEQRLRHQLREIVLANTQARVAERMGIRSTVIRKTLNPGVRATLAAICRLADAVDCEVTLVARDSPVRLVPPYEATP